MGNGKAPFGADEDRQSGLVDMVTYNSLTVDPVNGQSQSIPFFSLAFDELKSV